MVDSLLVAGVTPDCLDRDICLGKKSQDLYGLRFKQVKKLDEGGPKTSSALKAGTVQVGELFTGSSVIDPDFVLLEDDKGLQPADNPIALVRESIATPAVQQILNRVSAQLTLEAYNKMSTSIDVDGVSPRNAAETFLRDAGLDEKGTAGHGVTITVGAKNFAGARGISQAYALALQNAGYTVEFEDDLGNTDVVYNKLKRGEIDLYGEYEGTVLSELQGRPTSNTASTYALLVEKLAGTGLVATEPAPAQDVNGFYVTSETALKYHLARMSDLTKTTTG